MANDESDWLQRFLQTGIYPPDVSQPHFPANDPSPSSVNRELSLGVPSPYQMLMTMTNNNPSQYFQRHTENGTATVPQGTLYVDPREVNPSLIRARLASPGTYQVVPEGNAAPQSIHRLSHSYQSSATPVGERSDNPPYSGPQTAPQNAYTSSISQRPQMTAPIESPALQNHSQPSKALPALTENHQSNSAHSASYPNPPASASQQPSQQEPAFIKWSAAQKPSQPFKTSHVKASPASGNQYQGNSVQPGGQSTCPGSILPKRPTVPVKSSSPTIQHLSQPSKPSPTPATLHPSSSSHPGQKPHSSAPRHPMPPSAPSPAIQQLSQPSGPSPTPANQNASNSTYPIQASASSLPPTSQRHPMPQSASAVRNPAPIPRPPYNTPQTQQDPNSRDHVTKKRRLEDGSSETKTRPESQQQKTTGPHHPKTPAPTNLSSFTYSSPGGNSLRNRADITQVFNKLDALEKAEYDPTTIARDILIASGRHPTERPLNFHLFPLKDIFVGMTISSDLDTIRWDLVEAETRDQARIASMGLSHPPHQPQQPLTQPAPQSKPLNAIGRPSWPGSSQTQQSFVNTAKPTPSVQNQQFNVPSAPPDNKPKQTSLPSAPTTQQPTEQQPSISPKSNPKSVSVGNTPKKSPVVNPRNQTGPSKQSPVINIPNKTPPVDLTKRGPAGSPARRASPADQPKQTSGAKPAKQTPIVSIPKRTSPQLAVAVSIPKREQSVPPKKRRKQTEAPKMVGKKQPMVEVSVPIKGPVSYPVFMCKWKDCHASLHNLSILKKHVMKIHIPHHLTCEWDGCKRAENMAAAKLYEHILSEHVEPIAWELGDGPSVPATVDNDTSASLKPFAQPGPSQTGGEDSLIFPASDSSIRAFNKVHENTSRPQKAEEILKAVQRLKERIGVGLDPGGCELATPARNERVSNDEEIYIVVPKQREA
ncbi:C2H2 finger domain protein [Aspergillus sclerotialis]|uniref:C2H2 finger domain protein n=1 Tax=Aspergillus sclerotialis TaxID=2070753 RepID=A0A3A3A2X0_9EURO|nr:C2H2 finger domain protein [Aspergillus sclerotialis]